MLWNTWKILSASSVEKIILSKPDLLKSTKADKWSHSYVPSCASNFQNSSTPSCFSSLYFSKPKLFNPTILIGVLQRTGNLFTYVRANSFKDLQGDWASGEPGKQTLEYHHLSPWLWEPGDQLVPPLKSMAMRTRRPDCATTATNQQATREGRARISDCTRTDISSRRVRWEMAHLEVWEQLAAGMWVQNTAKILQPSFGESECSKPSLPWGYFCVQRMMTY